MVTGDGIRCFFFLCPALSPLGHKATTRGGAQLPLTAGSGRPTPVLRLAKAVDGSHVCPPELSALPCSRPVAILVGRLFTINVSVSR
jgi:hypothetical protein